MQPIFPPHHNYPSHPDEPRLLIPPKEHCNGKMAPLIWDPTIPTGTEAPEFAGEHNATQPQEHPKRDVRDCPTKLPFRAIHQGPQDWSMQPQPPRPVSASSSSVRSPLTVTVPDCWIQGAEPSAAARQLMMYFECACCIHQPAPQAKRVSHTPDDFSIGSDFMHEVHEEAFRGDPREGSAFQVFEQRVSHTPDDFFVDSDFMHEVHEETFRGDPREGCALQVFEQRVSHTFNDFFVRSDFTHEDKKETVWADPREGSAFQVYERQY